MMYYHITIHTEKNLFFNYIHFEFTKFAIFKCKK